MDAVIVIALLGIIACSVYSQFFNPHWFWPARCVFFASIVVCFLPLTIFWAVDGYEYWAVFMVAVLGSAALSWSSGKKAIKFRQLCVEYPDMSLNEKFGVVVRL